MCACLGVFGCLCGCVICGCLGEGVWECLGEGFGCVRVWGLGVRVWGLGVLECRVWVC